MAAPCDNDACQARGDSPAFIMVSMKLDGPGRKHKKVNKVELCFLEIDRVGEPIDRVGEPTAETNKRLAANQKKSGDPLE